MEWSTTGRLGPCAAVLAVAVGLFSAAAVAQDRVEDLPEIVIKVNQATGPTPLSDLSWGAWEKAVLEASAGKIKFETYWSSSLLTLVEMPDGLPAGLADMGGIGSPYTPERFPITNWYTTLGSVGKGGVPYALLVNTAVHNETVLSTPEIIKEWEDQGLKVLGTDYVQGFDQYCKRPVTNLAEVAGARIRVPGKIWSSEAEAIGMTPVPLVPTEIYEAFTRGIIDCINLHPSGYVALGLMDIEGDKHLTTIEYSGWMSTYVAISMNKWNSLPPLAQKILVDTMPVYWAGYVQGGVFSHRDFYGKTAEKNITVHAVDPALKAKMDAFQQAEVKRMIETAPPGVSDPQAVIDRFMSLTDKWAAFVQNDMGISPAPADPAARVEAYINLKDPDYGPWKQKMLDEVVRPYLEPAP